MLAWKQIYAALAGAALALATSQSAVANGEISGFAIVQENSALKLSGALIYLYGIYVPPTEQSCYTFVRPPPCGPRASLALDFKTSGHFVHCWPVAANPDGSLVARCSSEGEDLSAWMLQQGWAVALPDAPMEYQALERIAQAKGIGIWGFPVDLIHRRYKR
jgi:endonuclease YncB( thermonuclease family)